MKKLSLWVNKLLAHQGVLVELGQPNWLLSQGTLLLGADVRHEGGKPSIAGLVSTWTPPFVHYYASCRAQEGQQETRSREHIDDLKGMVREVLDRIGWMPRRVLMFRDGVSEGQFPAQVDEMNSLFEAFEAHGAARPALAWLVVQKRHQTRLAPADNEPKLHNGNVVPGTVADRGVAHPQYENFFLVSHKAIQGTAVPAHYYVLHNTLTGRDGQRICKDDIIEVAHQLCHLYPRASSSVSYATPAYYADHLCERGHELGLRRELQTCEQLNGFFASGEFVSSPLQGTNFFC